MGPSIIIMATEGGCAAIRLAMAEHEDFFVEQLSGSPERYRREHGIALRLSVFRGCEVSALDCIFKRFASSLGRAYLRIPRDDARATLVTTTDGPRGLRVDESLQRRMGDIERELAPRRFFRIDKGHPVNLNAVDGIQGNSCLIAGELLPISRAEFPAELTKALWSVHPVRGKEEGSHAMPEGRCRI